MLYKRNSAGGMSPVDPETGITLDVNLPGSFEPTLARDLTPEQQGVVRLLFGSELLPLGSVVSFDGTTLVIEAFPLDEFVDILPSIDVNLDERFMDSSGKYHFPFSEE